MKKLAYLALAVALTACGSKTEMPQASNDYAVVTLGTQSADLNTSYPATIKGIQDIDIFPKVAGHITRVCVDEGAFVRAGQTLFLIDDVQQRAAVRQAEATVNVCKTQIATQRLTVENKKMLYGKQIVSKYDLDVAENQLASLQAQLAQAEASLASARDQLRFCTVSSPASGVIGSIPYRVGTLVSAQMAAPLTTVSNISQMYVYFSMTEDQLLALTRQSGGSAEAMKEMPALSLKLSDGTTYDKQGRVTSISGIIEQGTGAVQVRATFDNGSHVLRTGATGSVLVPVHQDAAILVPQKATFDIQNKKYVYIVKKDNTVETREISVLVQNDGTNYVITSGLSAGDRIVVEGVNQLKSGTKINPITPAQAEKNRQAANQALKDGKMPGEK